MSCYAATKHKACRHLIDINLFSMAFFQCSVTCGQGQRRREVHCRFNDGKTSNDCDENTRPQSVLDCVLRACPVWREESWREVSSNYFVCGRNEHAVIASGLEGLLVVTYDHKL